MSPPADVAPAHPRAGRLRLGAGHAGARRAMDGPQHDRDVRDLHAAVRAPQPALFPDRDANPRRRRSDRVPDVRVPCVRVVQAGQDWRVRHVDTARLPQAEVAGPLPAGGSSSRTPGRLTLAFHLRGVPEGVQDGGDAQPDRLLAADPVRPEARRALARQERQCAAPARGAEARRVEGVLQRASLRQARATRAAAPEIALPCAPTLPSTAASRRARLRQDFREAILAARLQRRVFLELFAGGGNLSKHTTKLGHAVIAFDIIYGDHFDLRYNDVYNMVKGWITSKSICGMWLGTPCEDLTRARRGPPGSEMPNRLHDNDHVRVLQGLKPKDLELLKRFNTLTDRAGVLQRLAYQYKIVGGEGNPCTSVLRVCSLLG